MEEILEFTRTQLSRKVYKRLLYKSEDADNIKSLEDKLTHAFRMFEVYICWSIYDRHRLTEKFPSGSIERQYATVPTLDCPAD